MRGFTAVLVASLFVLPSILAAQEPPPIEPGARVRVTAPSLGMYRQPATFEAVESGVLVVTSDSTMRCPLTDVTRLDVSRGRQAQWLKGAGIGFLLGGLPGFVAGAIACPDYECDPFTQATAAAAFGGIFGAAGAVVGATVGAVAPGSPLKGAAWGGGVGAILLFARQPDVDEPLLFAVAGASVVLGAAVGAITQGERWEEVPLDRLRVSFAPMRDGSFAFGLSVAF